jgi:hypothetical protein
MIFEVLLLTFVAIIKSFDEIFNCYGHILQRTSQFLYDLIMAGTYDNIFIFFECPIVLVVVSLHVDSELFFEELSKAATLSNDEAHLILFHHKLRLCFHLINLDRLLLS